MKLQETIRRILREELTDKPKLLDSFVKGRGVQSHRNQVKGTKMDNWESRNAHDLMCKPGTIVRSPVNGKILTYKFDKSKNPYVYGLSIRILTSGGKDQIFITHLDPNISKVSLGQEVKKGDVVGVIGDPKANGKKFDAHLHISTKDESHDIYHYVEKDLTIK